MLGKVVEKAWLPQTQLPVFFDFGLGWKAKFCVNYPKIEIAVYMCYILIPGQTLTLVWFCRQLATKGGKQ